MTEILDTCRIWRDIEKNPFPLIDCKIDIKMECGSILLNCRFAKEGDISFQGVLLQTFDHITQWRPSK